MSISESILSWLNLAPLNELDATKRALAQSNEQIGSLKIANSDLQKRVARLGSDLASIGREVTSLNRHVSLANAQQLWCKASLTELPPDTPDAIRRHTTKDAATILRQAETLYDLIDPANFSTSAQWALYWCLAHASAAAITATQAAKREDGISGDFLNELAAQARGLPQVSAETGLQIAYNAIFEQCEPALKEAQVGADILLIVAGSSLVPDGLARLFWIQAKREKTSAFKLHYEQANTGGYQVDALAKMSSEAQGSFALYMQYAGSLTFVPAVPVAKLGRTSYTADLALLGTRLPEYIVASSAKANAGTFKNVKAILAFLDKASDNKPLYVVTISAGDRQRDKELTQLLTTVSDYYLEKLGMSKERNKGKDRGMER
ncbi:hypothetical protein KY495_06520 [Massilia sp. PAMC28688]|uniref:hypothetical protein n=1 Tax=Massilia sp. PAMC28688 TaxID=2861283 RepID=UPI001C638A1F|nr:hypothetical protein [Massilia sp. PAMC28688]QYF94833.1 hypothetical protein KY495_06520 [Massilia sp. PAMC28688]